jgi:transposase
MVRARTEVENGSALAKALNYALNRWASLLRYTEDGRLEIDNNIAERSVRGSCVGKKNYLFFGSDSGGKRAAIAYSLIETCKLNHIDPNRYLQYVLERIADYPINRVEELLPWNVAAKLNQPDQVTQALVA